MEMWIIENIIFLRIINIIFFLLSFINLFFIKEELIGAGIFTVLMSVGAFIFSFFI